MEILTWFCIVITSVIIFFFLLTALINFLKPENDKRTNAILQDVLSGKKTPNDLITEMNRQIEEEKKLAELQEQKKNKAIRIKKLKKIEKSKLF